MKKISFKQSSYNYVHSDSLFFNEDTLSRSFIIEYDNKEWIHHSANQMDYLFFLLQGKAKIVKTEENGKQAILQFLKPGDFIGELTFVQVEQTTKDIISMGQTVCLAIPMDYAQKNLMNNNQFLRKISHYIGMKLLNRTEHSVSNQLFELKYRLAELLLRISVNDSYQEKHTEIAEYLGVSYRHLLYTFQQFREQGLIKKEKKELKINRHSLENLLKTK